MQKKGEVTIHDIAKDLNLSASTVSRALKNNPLIKEATREKIQNRAKELGYRPNIIASNLRTQKTNTIGVIIPRIDRHFLSSVISGIEYIAYKQGFNVIIAQSHDSAEREKLLVHSMFNKRVDGLLVSVAMKSTTGDHFRLFTEKKVPLVFFDRFLPGMIANKVLSNDFDGAFQATCSLLNNGYKNLIHIGGPTEINIYNDRLNGFKSALNNHQIEFKPTNYIQCHLTKIEAIEIMGQLFNSPNPPDAIFCANDASALGCLLYAREHNINVPDSLGIIGYSNEPFTEVVTPSLSTVNQSASRMGETAASLLIDMIEKRQELSQSQTITLDTNLIERESSRK